MCRFLGVSLPMVSVVSGASSSEIYRAARQVAGGLGGTLPVADQIISRCQQLSSRVGRCAYAALAALVIAAGAWSWCEAKRKKEEIVAFGKLCVIVQVAFGVEESAFSQVSHWLAETYPKGSDEDMPYDILRGAMGLPRTRANPDEEMSVASQNVEAAEVLQDYLPRGGVQQTPSPKKVKVALDALLRSYQEHVGEYQKMSLGDTPKSQSLEREEESAGQGAQGLHHSTQTALIHSDEDDSDSEEDADAEEVLKAVKEETKGNARIQSENDAHIRAHIQLDGTDKQALRRLHYRLQYLGARDPSSSRIDQLFGLARYGYVLVTGCTPPHPALVLCQH